MGGKGKAKTIAGGQNDRKQPKIQQKSQRKEAKDGADEGWKDDPATEEEDDQAGSSKDSLIKHLRVSSWSL